jgi:hypothetical protein
MHITSPTIIYLEFLIKTTKIEYIEFGVFLYRPTNLIYSACFPVNKHEYLKPQNSRVKRGLGQIATTTINSRKKAIS